MGVKGSENSMKETIITEYGRTIIRMELSDLGPITQRERESIQEAAKRPILYDEDCPPLSPAMKAEVERLIAARERRA